MIMEIQGVEADAAESELTMLIVDGVGGSITETLVEIVGVGPRSVLLLTEPGTVGVPGMNVPEESGNEELKGPDGNSVPVRLGDEDADAAELMDESGMPVEMTMADVVVSAEPRTELSDEIAELATDVGVPKLELKTELGPAGPVYEIGVEIAPV